MFDFKGCASFCIIGCCAKKFLYFCGRITATITITPRTIETTCCVPARAILPPSNPKIAPRKEYVTTLPRLYKILPVRNERLDEVRTGRAIAISAHSDAVQTSN